MSIPNPELLGRLVGESPANASQRASTDPSIAATVRYASGASGSAGVQIFVSKDDEDRGGYVLRLTVDDDGGGSFAPTAKNLPNGVELHLTGEAEGAAFLSALSGLLASFHAANKVRGVGV